MANPPLPPNLSEQVLKAVFQRDRLEILLACSERPRRVDSFNLAPGVAGMHVDELAQAGLLSVEDDVCRVWADWRPFAAELARLVASCDTTSRDVDDA